MKKGIAFFDFDGTITTKDTLLEFIKFCKGKTRFYTGFLLNSPYLVAYKLKIISNQAAKEKVLQHFFKKTPVAHFRELCKQFSVQVLPGLIRPGAIAEIEKLKKDNVAIIIVSASPRDWIEPWSASVNVQLIATELEVNNETLTGRIIGKNCHGDEKVRRIREQFDLSSYPDVYAYGDSSGDKPMLSLATRPFMKPFRN